MQRISRKEVANGREALLELKRTVAQAKASERNVKLFFSAHPARKNSTAQGQTEGKRRRWSSSNDIFPIARAV